MGKTLAPDQNSDDSLQDAGELYRTVVDGVSNLEGFDRILYLREPLMGRGSSNRTAMGMSSGSDQ